MIGSQVHGVLTKGYDVSSFVDNGKISIIIEYLLDFCISYSVLYY